MERMGLIRLKTNQYAPPLYSTAAPAHTHGGIRKPTDNCPVALPLPPLSPGAAQAVPDVGSYIFTLSHGVHLRHQPCDVYTRCRAASVQPCMP